MLNNPSSGFSLLIRLPNSVFDPWGVGIPMTVFRKPESNSQINRSPLRNQLAPQMPNRQEKKVGNWPAMAARDGLLFI